MNHAKKEGDGKSEKKGEGESKGESKGVKVTVRYS